MIAATVFQSSSKCAATSAHESLRASSATARVSLRQTLAAAVSVTTEGEPTVVELGAVGSGRAAAEHDNGKGPRRPDATGSPNPRLAPLTSPRPLPSDPLFHGSSRVC